eukprot:gnl/TRDRNA2_/TRDRNA2_164704_c0_seq1.p1 gnl/TRDRNA2_/TRDRNA2_164704_c0~~gnl/TRDRNA2_/TRDRNA2_164704_c0_seq1.p1  ORF type:complete len:521 (+),score=87.67 gnl/TRDRNA2_/TRDRNA2_164704_c0_seq1:91-1653(+)
MLRSAQDAEEEVCPQKDAAASTWNPENAGSAVLRRCDHCHKQAAEGKKGPIETLEYMDKWFCASCWTKWDITQRKATSRTPFGASVQMPFACTSRLTYLPKSLVDDMTSGGFAMVNEHDCNEFYRAEMEACGLSGRRVLDIGTGSGLLAMMAARLGARHVVATEECGDLVRLARANVAANGLDGVVEVRHSISTALELIEAEKCSVLVSETLGAWMTCEGIVQWCEDACDRLLEAGADVIPGCGTQYAVLIESEGLAALTSCWHSIHGIDISTVMELQDTVTCFWSRQYGIRLSELDYKEVCEPFPVLTVKFGCTRSADLARTSIHVASARCTGRAHAVLTFWEVQGISGRILSTDPKKRRGAPWAFVRDASWGNMIQLIDAAEDANEDESNWQRYGDTTVFSDEEAAFSVSAEDLVMVRYACVYHGCSGFIVTSAGVAKLFAKPWQDLADSSNHVPCIGCTLYIARFQGFETRAPMLPKPLDVAKDEKIAVMTVHSLGHTSVQFRVLPLRDVTGGAQDL